MNRRENYILLSSLRQRTEEDTKPQPDEKSLDLSSKALTTLPENMVTPSNVIDLNLSFNILEAIPNQIEYEG